VTGEDEDDVVTNVSDVGKPEDPFGIGDASVPHKGVGITVGTDLAGGNEQCSLAAAIEGTVTVVSVTVNVRFGSVEGTEPPDSHGTDDERDGTTVEDSREMIDDGEDELVYDGGCCGAALAVHVGTDGWVAGLDTDDIDGKEVMLELNWSPTGTVPLMLMLVEIPSVVVRVIVMQLVVVVLQAVTIVVQGVRTALPGGVWLVVSFSC
ncbi:hypothetical protein GE21DRAFT_1208229, partial [Neurospora crassa]